MDIDSKIWGYSATGTLKHAYEGERSLCRRVSTPFSFKLNSGQDYFAAARSTLCSTCDKRFQSAVEEEANAVKADAAVPAAPAEDLQAQHSVSQAADAVASGLKVTAEMVQALAFLRKPTWSAVDMKAAVDVLDNAGVFAAIDVAAETTVLECTCMTVPGGSNAHRSDCPGDPRPECTCPGVHAPLGIHDRGCPQEPTAADNIRRAVNLKW